MSFGTDRGEVLVPTVSDDGRNLSPDEAMKLYRQTGKHLGIFLTPEAATAYAKQLHDQQAQEYAPTMSELRSGILPQNDPDTLTRRAAESVAPRNGNVVPFPTDIRAAPIPLTPATIPGGGGSVAQRNIENNNPGNIKSINGGYESYDSPQAGINAIGDWLERAQTVHGLTTVRQLIDDPAHGYAPSADPGNRGKNLAEVAARRLGVNPDAPIDVTNPAIKAKFIDAILMQEQGSTASGYEQRQDYQSSGHAELSRIGGEISKVVDQLVKEGGRSPESMQKLQMAMDKMNEYQEKMLKLAQNPPSPEPRDMFQRLGGLATVVGILGGLITKQPLAASLEAGAAAMDAYNKGDETTYKIQRDNWMTNLETMGKLAQFQHDQVRDVLSDERASTSERMGRLQAVLSALGHQEAAARAQIGDERWLRQWNAQRGDANRNFRRLLDDDKERVRHDKAMEDKQSKGKFGSIDDLMERWKTDFSSKEGREPTTSEIAAQRAELTKESRPQGRQLAQMTQRLQIGANEVAKAVEAMTALPYGTSLGIFGGAQAALGAGLLENVKKSLANAVTPESAQVLRALTAGVTRGLAILEAGGAAQGLVGLGNQLQADLPQANDTGLTIAAKFADVRQIVEAATEVLSTNQDLSKDQRDLLERINKRVSDAIPFTTVDVAKLVGSPGDETIKDFAAKVGLGKLPEGIPTGSRQIGTKDGHPVYQAPDGSRYLVQ